jgi:type II secretory pathway predicted ATPase ExeA
MARAGASSAVFTRDAGLEIARRSGGLPARVNHLADLSLAAAYGMGMRAVGPAVVRMVGEELEGGGPPAGSE